MKINIKNYSSNFCNHTTFGCGIKLSLFTLYNISENHIKWIFTSQLIPKAFHSFERGDRKISDTKIWLQLAFLALHKGNPPCNLKQTNTNYGLYSIHTQTCHFLSLVGFLYMENQKDNKWWRALRADNDWELREKKCYTRENNAQLPVLLRMLLEPKCNAFTCKSTAVF